MKDCYKKVPITIRYRGKKVACHVKRRKHGGNDFERSLEMMKYFQQESMYRQQHYWNFLFKTFSLSTVVSILPIVSEIFGIKLNDLALTISWYFPGMGAFIAFASFFILLDEASKIRAVNEAKYRINKNLMTPQYQYIFYNNDVGKDNVDIMTKKDSLKSKMKYLAFKMPCLVLIAEWTVSGVVCWILHCGRAAL